ncbi:MAG TPA: copper chaperone PCu(A)C [Paenirhodobacter sp.]
MIRSLLIAAALALPLTPAAAETVNDVRVGGLDLHGAFARATLPGAPVAGGFLTITNTGGQDDRLTGGTAPFAAAVQVHDMAMQGEVMKMRALPDGLVIPAGQTVVLKPGSLHLMFVGLTRPLAEGTTEQITLTFEKAGPVVVAVPVIPAMARAGD